MEQRNREEKVTKTSKFHEKYKFTDSKSSPKQANWKERHTKAHYRQTADEEKILKAGRGKWQTTRWKLILIIVDFPSEAMKARREWNNI